jgi:hypothetical protein
MLSLSNDVAEREEELITMRKREKVYQQRIGSKDRAHEAEEQIRAQLCKRLEELLVEKEDLRNSLLTV